MPLIHVMYANHNKQKKRRKRKAKECGVPTKLNVVYHMHNLVIGYVNKNICLLNLYIINLLIMFRKKITDSKTEDKCHILHRCGKIKISPGSVAVRLMVSIYRDAICNIWAAGQKNIYRYYKKKPYEGITSSWT